MQPNGALSPSDRHTSPPDRNNILQQRAIIVNKVFSVFFLKFFTHLPNERYYILFALEIHSLRFAPKTFLNVPKKRLYKFHHVSPLFSTLL